MKRIIQDGWEKFDRDVVSHDPRLTEHREFIRGVFFAGALWIMSEGHDRLRKDESIANDIAAEMEEFRRETTRAAIAALTQQRFR